MSIQGNINQLLTLGAGASYLGLKEAQAGTEASKAIAESMGADISPNVEAAAKAKYGNSIIGNKKLQSFYDKKGTEGFRQQLGSKGLHTSPQPEPADNTPYDDIDMQWAQAQAESGMQNFQKKGTAIVQQKQAFIKHKNRVKGNR